MPFYGSTATNPGRTGQGSRHADAEASGSLLATSTIGDTLLTAISFRDRGKAQVAHGAFRQACRVARNVRETAALLRLRCSIWHTAKIYA